LDEQRQDFEPTFWTRTVKTGAAGVPERAIDKVEQRWFVGAHANVGGGYASDPLPQRPLVRLMGKAASLGLAIRDQVAIDTTQVAPPINDSYREFVGGFYRLLSKPFYRPVGAPPDTGRRRRRRGSTKRSTARSSSGGGWTNLVAWMREKVIDPAKLTARS
jgi:Uncharacterized alpha/beta hydrolase domain (DUF2235)